MSSFFGLTEEHKQFLAEKRAMYVADQPEWVELESKLLALGGEAVVYANEEDMKKLLTRGQAFPGRGALMMLGAPSRCHANTARLHEANEDNSRIVTGYALSPDGLWRQHTWGLTGTEGRGRIVETTQKRVRYFGFILTPKEARRFCYENE